MQKINGSVTSLSRKFKPEWVQTAFTKFRYNYHLDDYFANNIWEQATEEECIESFNKLITKPRLCKK